MQLDECQAELARLHVQERGRTARREPVAGNECAFQRSRAHEQRPEAFVPDRGRSRRDPRGPVDRVGLGSERGVSPLEEFGGELGRDLLDSRGADVLLERVEGSLCLSLVEVDLPVHHFTVRTRRSKIPLKMASGPGATPLNPPAPM